MEVRSDRTYPFDADASTVWGALGRVDEYRRWWPWLRRFDAKGLVPGDRWECLVRPPLPYQLGFSIHLLEVVEPERIEAEVGGDLTGRAELTIRSMGEGCQVRLTSTLAPARGPLRSVARLAPWLAHYGHDWVLATGLRQFRQRAL